MHFNVHFTRMTEEGLQRMDAGFWTPVVTLNDLNFLDLTLVTGSIDKSIDAFNKRGSNWILDHIIDATLTTCINRLTQGSSFIETPENIANKMAVVNVKNWNDELCFAWSVLASLYPAKHNPDRLTNYESHLNELDLSGLTFPLKVSQIPKFERQNPDISVNVNAYENDPVSEIVPLHISPHKQRQYHVNLLLLTDDSTARQHYVLIKNLSRLVQGRTASQQKSHVCPYCLHCFSVSRLLDEHIPECKIHSPQRISYPAPDEKVKFRNTIRTLKVPFVLYCDFESYLKPATDDDDGTIISRHIPSGFCCLRVSSYSKYVTEPVVFSGENVMERFFEHLRSEKREICRILGFQAPMKLLTDEQQATYDSSFICPKCNVTYCNYNRKVRHHDHVSGDFVSALCNNCNLQVKPRQALIRKKIILQIAPNS